MSIVDCYNKFEIKVTNIVFMSNCENTIKFPDMITILELAVMDPNGWKDTKNGLGEFMLMFVWSFRFTIMHIPGRRIGSCWPWEILLWKISV